MLLIGALAVMLIFVDDLRRWRQYAARRSSRCLSSARWRLSRRFAPVTGAFQHLGQVIASALRITELTGKNRVTLAGRNSRAGKVTLTLRDVSFRYPDQPISRKQCPLITG